MRLFLHLRYGKILGTDDFFCLHRGRSGRVVDSFRFRSLFVSVAHDSQKVRSADGSDALLVFLCVAEEGRGVPRLRVYSV